MRARFVACALALGLAACRIPAEERRAADDASYKILADARQSVLGHDEPFTIETPADSLRRRLLLDQHLPNSGEASLNSHDVQRIPEWPDAEYARESQPEAPAPAWDTHTAVVLTLFDALAVGARNSRDYQLQKELVFQNALALDLERDRFRKTWVGVLNGDVTRDLSTNPPITGATASAAGGVSQLLKNGASWTVNVALDLVKLLTQGSDSSFGILADATIAVPLLRGSGRFVVEEPLKQAEREVIYSIYGFERFKRTFAVQIASEYYAVLQLAEQADNERENYRWLIEAARRAQRLSEAERLENRQVDQTRQDELKARDSWVQAIRAYEGRLDTFKLLLGLPVDAALELDRSELGRLVKSTTFPPLPALDEHVPADAPVEVEPPSREGGGPYEIAPDAAVGIALQNRLDLRVAVGRVLDGQRNVAVTADLLRADLTLLGAATAGERRTLSTATSPDAKLRLSQGDYSVLAQLDLPLERTSERNQYRNSLIDFERSVREVQRAEDQVKFEVREDLRVLQEARERVRIQDRSLALAEQRVDVTSRLVQVGRAEARDFLEAQSDLTDAKNALSLERVRYRVAELSLQRDLDVLEVAPSGLWTELDPASLGAKP